MNQAGTDNPESVAAPKRQTADEREESDALNLYRQCMEIRNFEIQNLVNRNNFFMVFQGVLMAGVIQGSKEAPPIVIFLASGCGFLISLFQVGMSQGAKYWQEAWEYRLARAELRLKVAFEVVKKTGQAKSDHSVGEPERETEKPVVKDGNSNEITAYEPFAFQEMFSRKGDDTEKDVEKSLRLSGVKVNWVVKRYSVSKIPIYSGLVFAMFWLTIFLHTLKSPLGEFIPSLLVALPK